MGNICRSPTAEAVFRQRSLRAGLELEIDSAGTIAYHQGEAPDPRSEAAGNLRGYDFAQMRARRVEDEDFARFDLILAADKQNLSDLHLRCPSEHKHKLKLIMVYANSGVTEVPDPYYGGEKGFERVLDLLELAADGLITELKQQAK